MSLLATVAAAAAAFGGPAPQQMIVQQRPDMDARPAIQAAGGTVLRTVPLIDGLLVRLPAGRARALSAAPAVRAVSPDAPVVGTARKEGSGLNLQTAYDQSIRADRAWAAGITGAGVGVAVIDTGIAGDLPDFRVSAADGRSRVAVNAVVNPNATKAGDGYGHGTHIAGLIAGDGLNRPAADPLRGRYVGVAPGAWLLAVKAGDDDGSSSVLDIIDGLQFVVDHRADYGIRVVNLSLSSTVPESHLTDPLDAAVEAAWKAGVVVVAAAGNRGDAGDAVSYAPGNDPWVVSVGGVDDHGTRTVADDELASWSSRGTTQDGYAKPDVLAPGAHMVSTMGAGAAYRSLCPTCVVDSDYFRVGGTSMAAGVVSGAVADILQAHPAWTPDQLKRALVRRSRPVLDTNDDDTTVDAGGDAQDDGTDPTDTIAGGEVALDKVLGYYAQRTPWPANRRLPLNTFLDPSTGAIDYTRTSWTRTSWTQAADPLRTSWTLADWMRTSWTRTSWTAGEASCAELERTSWTRTSWTDAELASAHAECDALMTAVDPARTSWTRTSWTGTSWTSSFAK